jgi:hypothetical protein
MPGRRAKADPQAARADARCIWVKPQLEHDPKKWTPVLGKDHAECNNLERDDDSKKNHLALVVTVAAPDAH